MENAIADGELRGDDVGHFAAVAPTTVEVDDHAHHRRGQAEGEVVDGEGGHGPWHVGEALGLHLVDGVAGQAGPGRRHVAEAAHLAAAADEGVLPLLGAVHGRGSGSFGVRAAWGLPAHVAAPGQEGRIRQVVAPGGHLLRHRRQAGLGPRRLRCGQRSGGAQHQRVGPVGQRQHHDHLSGLRPFEHVAQCHGGLGRPEVAHRPGEIGNQSVLAHAEPLRDRLDRPHVQAGHDGVVDLTLGQAGVLERGGKRLAGQWHVELLAEALLPDVGIVLTGDAPAVEEFVAGCAASDQLGHRAVGRAQQRGGAVTAVTLFGRAGQTGAQIRDDGQRGAAATRSRSERLQQGGHRGSATTR